MNETALYYCNPNIMNDELERGRASGLVRCVRLPWPVTVALCVCHKTEFY